MLSLLSSTLPPPREEAEETGGGAGCYRAIGGTPDRHWGAFSYSIPVLRSTEEREPPRVTHLGLEKKKVRGIMIKSRWRAPESALRSLIPNSKRVSWDKEDGESEG